MMLLVKSKKIVIINFYLLLLFYSISNSFAAQTCTTTQLTGTNNDFEGISGSSDSNVITVGDKGEIFIYNGTSWSIMSSPTNQDLKDVYVLNSSFSVAVGKKGTILFNNSGTWSSSSSGTNEDFKAVWAFAANNIYTVGKKGELRYYNGAGWVDLSGVAGTGSKDLEAAWGDSNYFYALAKDGTLFRYNRNTSSWSTISTCASAVGDDTKGIWGDNAGNIYITVKGGAVYKYNGSTCVQVASSSEDLVAIYGSNTTGEIYAVGDNGEIVYFDGSNWITTSEGSEDIKDVWVSSAGNAYYSSKKGYTSTCTFTATPATSSCTTTTIASGEDLEAISGSTTSNVITVGKNGEVWQYNGTTWTQITVPSNPDEDLKDIYVINGNNSVAVGKNGTVIIQINGIWSVLSSPGGEDLKGVWAYSTSDIWVFGKKGSIFHWDGNAWANHKAAAGAGNSDDFEDSWGNSQYVYGLTKTGELFRYDRSGSSWSNITTCTGPNLNFKDLWGDSSGNIYLSGKDNNDGVVFKYNGTTCTQVTTTSEKLEGIYGSTTTGDIFAVGKNGQLTQYDGSSWTASTTGSEDFKDVWVAADGTAFYAGKNGQVTTCSIATSSIHHILITHDGSGLTCNPENITVNACTDATCSSISSSDVSVTLTPPGWVGGDTKTIISGSSVFQLRKSAAATYRMSASSSSPSASSTLECTNTAISVTNTTTACDIVFYDSGFIFDISDPQTACTTSGSVTVSAVRKDLTSQQCVPSFTNRTENINFWTSYTNPTNGTTQLTINSGATNFTLATAAPGTAVALTFNTNGQATLTINYPDAGRLTLNSSFTGSGSEAGLIMTGSDVFTTIPAKFYVTSADANNDCASGDATCSAFKKAGETFNLNIRAACTDNTVTPNFQLNNIIVTHDNIAPNINEGTLSVGTFNMIAVDSGAHTIINETVSEVGVFTFTATTPNITDTSNIYYGLTLNSGTSDNIGRFYPDHFTVDSPTLSNRSDIVGCVDPFTYMDENMQFDFNLRAENSSNALTLNYVNTFAKLNVTTLAQMNYGATNNNTDYSVRTVASSSGNFTNGIAAVTATISLTRQSVTQVPLTAYTIGIAPQDSDAVLLANYNLALSGGSNTHGSLGQTELRFGRGIINNAFGSEFVALSVPWLAQYYNTVQSGFITNTDDSCTPLSTSILDLSNSGSNPAQGVSSISIGSGTTTATVNNNPVSSGDANLIFSPPSSPGFTDIDINFSTFDYLQFDWDNNGTHDNNPPTVRATFGSYRGDDRIIYWKELFN